MPALMLVAGQGACWILCRLSESSWLYQITRYERGIVERWITDQPLVSMENLLLNGR